MTLRWGFISDNRADFGVQRICRVLQVSRSGFYRWIAGAKAREVRQAADDALAAEIREIHTDHKGTYGVRRVHAELRGLGHTVNRKRVERLMRRHGLEGLHLRRCKRTTVPDRFAPPAPDLVQRDFSAGQLDEKWARLEIFQWLTYYNTRRRHSALNYLSPVEFEQQHLRVAKLSIAA